MFVAAHDAQAPSPSPAAPPAAGAQRRRAGGGAPSNVRGFNNLRGESSDEDDDKPQEWFTGGAQSGSVVQDPKGPKAMSNAERLDAMLQGARDAGAVDGVAEDLNPGARRTAGGQRAFTGTGRTLGGAGGASSEAAAAEPSPDVPASLSPETHVITFWANGFTVNDGPLRAYDDPANTAFMQAVGKGVCPRELEPKDRNTPININLVKKDTDYVPPPEPKYRAFTGSGRTLGGSSGAGGSSGGGSSSAPAPASASGGGGDTTEWVVDESAPTTSIQLRLRDGSRLVARFNLTHTVADVRAFIAQASPGCATGDYALQLAGFPPKQLSDESQPVSDGLANAVIIQR